MTFSVGIYCLGNDLAECCFSSIVLKCCLSVVLVLSYPAIVLYVPLHCSDSLANFNFRIST